MHPYANRQGNSGVTAYETGPRHIDVRFVNGGTYRYDNHIPGPEKLAKMKTLAHTGKGLSTYISQVIKDDYAEKLE